VRGLSRILMRLRRRRDTWMKMRWNLDLNIT
jgi:hypothetical protein